MTADTPRNIEELAAIYASGALAADERAAVEARLAAGDEALRAAIERFGAATEALGLAAGSIAPPREIRQRLLDRAAESRDPTSAAEPPAAEPPAAEPPAAEPPSDVRPALPETHDPNLAAAGADQPSPPRRRPRTNRRRQRHPSVAAANWPAATAEQTGQLELALASTAEWTAVAEGAEVRVLHLDRPARRVTMLARLAPGTVYPPHFHREGEECFVVEGDLIVGDHVLGPRDYQFAPADTWHGAQTTKAGCVCVIITSLTNLDRAFLERLLRS